MFTIQALLFLLLLIPGFFSYLIITAAVPRREHGNLVVVVVALLLSLVTYTFFMLCWPTKFKGLVEAIRVADAVQIISLYPISILITLSFSIALSLLVIYTFRFDLHMWLLRLIGATDLTSRISIWYDVFTDKKCFVVVTLEDGRRIYGWPEYYSETETDPCIYLHKPYWINPEGKYISFEVLGVLITPQEKIKRIEFVESGEGK